MKIHPAISNGKTGAFLTDKSFQYIYYRGLDKLSVHLGFYPTRILSIAFFLKKHSLICFLLPHIYF